MSENEQIRRAAMQSLQSLYQAGVRDIPKPSGGDLPQVEPTASQPTSSNRQDSVVEEKMPSPPSPNPSAIAKIASARKPADRMKELTVLSQEVADCTACEELASQRTQTVFGVGDPNARLCFLGEAPGADEDRLGEPFVGRAGQLLTKIIEAMTLSRDEVYILNILKCRPPGNRNPAPAEVANCRPFFTRQLDLVQPEFICCLGSVAAQNLLDTKTSIGKLRGKFHDWNGRRVLATYHPAYLLRNPPAKKLVWEDMQILMKEMGIKIPKTA